MDPKNQKQGKLATAETAQAQASDTKNPCEDIINKLHGHTIPVSLQPSATPVDCSNIQFQEMAAVSDFIRTSRIDFNCYKKAMDNILNKIPSKPVNGSLSRKSLQDDCIDNSLTNTSSQAAPTALFAEVDIATNGFNTGALFSNSKAYYILKFATEQYVYAHFGLDREDMPAPLEVLPYIKLVEASIGDVSCKYEPGNFRPLFAELIWNYWMEEGMLGKAMHAIKNRFQNKRTAAGLGNLALDPLRPLNNILWGYIQDGINQLTPARKLAEFDQQYGLPVFAMGGLKVRGADSRSTFISAFHSLLYKCSLFYKEADNLMKVPDAFPLLNALREVHMVLSEGANNQFGDLPITARIETLMAQYILSRPEMREFLGGRVMVPYDEAWMDRVDTMKAISGWPGAGISYFRDLAVYGEQILLSIRWISWSQFKNRDFAREWAFLFREDVQRYIHCYQAVTGVDLSATEFAGSPDLKAAPPAYLLSNKAVQALRR